MAALVYPDSLPCPQRSPYQRAERRALSSIPGQRRARALWRDRLGTEPVQFFMTFEQVAIWLAWFDNEQLHGGAWFAASWRLPSGRGGVYRFIEAPSYPEYVAPIGWRVTATLEVRGRGMLPQSLTNVTPFEFSARDAALPGITYLSNVVTLTGFEGTAPVSVVGGEWRKSSDGGGSWSAWGSASGTSIADDQVQVRGVSNSAVGGVSTITLTVEDAAASFVVTTCRTYVEEFNGSAGTYTGGPLFDIYNAGGGTTTLNGTGAMVQTCTVVARGAMALRKPSFNEAVSRKYRRHFNLTASSGAHIFSLQKNLHGIKGQLAPTVNATWDLNNLNVIFFPDSGLFNYKNPSEVTVSYNASTHAWGSPGALPLSLGTDYVVELESDAAGARWRLALYDSSDVLIEQTPWVLWANTASRNASTYLSFGDYATDMYTVTGLTKAYGED